VHIYILVTKPRQWNFLQISQLSIQSGVHELFHWFFGPFTIFDGDFVKIVAPPSNENENYVAHLKERSILKNRWKPHENWPVNRHTLLVWTMSCTPSLTYKKKHQFSLLQPARVVRSPPKLCMLVENVVTILKGGNHFSIQRIVFPAGGNVDFWTAESIRKTAESIKNDINVISQRI